MELNELKLSDKRKEICKLLDLHNSDDILSYYPYKYEEYRITPYKDFIIGNQVVFEGELISYPTSFKKGRLTISRFKVLYEDNELLITIFNRPWIRSLRINERLTIFGKYEGNNKITATNYYCKDINDVIGIIPSYSIKEGISQNDIKKLIQYTFDKCKDYIVDNLPVDLINRHGLVSKVDAIEGIHFPSSRLMLTKALSRLKYEEFLRFYIGLRIIKGSDNKLKRIKEFSIDKVNELIDSLGFSLTSDQNKAKDDFLNDLSSSKIMYRLIQGEVGSGKTVVAVIGLYANYLAGFQGALLAPTEILVKQHYETISKLLKPFGVRIGLLYGAMDNENKVKKDIEEGNIDIVIGTHALFSEDVKYHNLGLVIADEQHRFGVKQRKALKNKGECVDFCLMSATPIPRTLATSIYGDMDISTIETMPSDRKGCKTYLIKENSIRSILDNIKDKLKEGRQIYIIAAAIDKSENYSAKDVNGLYKSLKDELKPFNVSLLHGKLSSEEKQDIMNDFNDNKIQVLISTTVVEVGVNVKNATMMIIYDADKFGLSQLHQLRGRVQRGSYEGTCYLLTNNNSEEVINRLEVLCKTNNGFEISLEDLKQRGPGDILGTRQSGLPGFVLADILKDTKFIESAKNDANMICDNLNNIEYKNYYDEIAQIAYKSYID